MCAAVLFLFFNSINVLGIVVKMERELYFCLQKFTTLRMIAEENDFLRILPDHRSNMIIT